MQKRQFWESYSISDMASACIRTILSSVAAKGSFSMDTLSSSNITVSYFSGNYICASCSRTCGRKKQQAKATGTAGNFDLQKLKIGKFRQKLTDFWQRTVILIEDAPLLEKTAPPTAHLHPRLEYFSR